MGETKEEVEQKVYRYYGPVQWGNDDMGIRTCTTHAPDIRIAKIRVKWLLANQLGCKSANMIKISDSFGNLMLEDEYVPEFHQLTIFDVFGEACI